MNDLANSLTVTSLSSNSEPIGLLHPMDRWGQEYCNLALNRIEDGIVTLLLYKIETMTSS